MGETRDNVYPNCNAIVRVIQVGGLSKTQLLEKLQQHSIRINELGERLLADKSFTTSEHSYELRAVELTVSELGFANGATLQQIYAAAHKLGLQLCPLELGPHLRIMYVDQPEGFIGKPSHTMRAPYGSITIASESIYEDEDFPKGFYLRKIDGELWLRGYVADDEHVWEHDDRFVFLSN
ncbi:helicase [Sporosarcina sp. OR05]|uniref:helicase n=1 Tax=Sporosarcina sp. OR05 TaxID=2969819 RepID=UPI003529D789